MPLSGLKPGPFQNRTQSRVFPRPANLMPRLRGTKENTASRKPAKSAGRNLQRMIEADLENGSLFEAQIMIGEESGDRADACSGSRADPRAFAAAFHRPRRRPDAGADRNGLNFMFRAHASA